MLRMPPVVDERPPRGEVVEKDENLSGAVKNRVIFTDTTHHKEDKVVRYHNIVYSGMCLIEDLQMGHPSEGCPQYGDGPMCEANWSITL